MGQQSQYRKFINFGGGEEDTAQGPLSSAPPPDPEAQAVLARMNGLNEAERSHITTYVNSLVAAGLWAKLVDFWALPLNPTDFLTSFKGAVTLVLFGTANQTPGFGLQLQPNAYAQSVAAMDTFLTASGSAFGGYVKTFSQSDKDNITRYWGANDGVNRAQLWWNGSVEGTVDFRWGEAENIPLLLPSGRPLNDVIITGDDGAGNRYGLGQDDVYYPQAHTLVALPAVPFATNGTNNDGSHQVGRNITDCCWFFLQGMIRTELTTFRQLTNEFMDNLGVPDVPV